MNLSKINVLINFYDLRKSSDFSASLLQRVGSVGGNWPPEKGSEGGERGYGGTRGFKRNFLCKYISLICLLEVAHFVLMCTRFDTRSLTESSTSIISGVSFFCIALTAIS